MEQSSVGVGGGGASENFDPNMYCWSHGYKNYPNHNSAACRNKKEGHKCEATRQNTLAQSNTTIVKVNAEQQNTITKLTNKITTLEKKLEQSSVGGGGGGASEKFDPNMYC